MVPRMLNNNLDNVNFFTDNLKTCNKHGKRCVHKTRSSTPLAAQQLNNADSLAAVEKPPLKKANTFPYQVLHNDTSISSAESDSCEDFSAATTSRRLERQLKRR